MQPNTSTFPSVPYSQQHYTQQLEQKIQRITLQFTPFQPPALEIFSSPNTHFRMRAEFRIWHTDTGLFYAMFERDEQGRKKVIRVDDFPIACQAINQLMPNLLIEIQKYPILSERLFEIDFLASLHGEMLVSMIYRKPLNNIWQDAAELLQHQLNIKIIGRSRGQKLVLTEDFVLEQLRVNQHTFIYQQIENGFSQPNAVVCEKMLNWACDVAQHQPHTDLLELYCGHGNFTLPLSNHFRQVLATELAKSSVYAAEWNIQTNKIDNIKIARLSAEEFTQAYQQIRTFRRLREQKIELSDYQFSTIFVDPPRSGIDEHTLVLMSQFEHIIYISCNPDSLFDNLQILLKTHRIIRFALFDQFPYTHHVELGVYLEKRSLGE